MNFGVRFIVNLFFKARITSTVEVIRASPIAEI